MAEPVLTDKTGVKLTAVALVTLLFGAMGVHPYAMAQVRSVVREENQVIKLETDLQREKDFNGLRLEVRELTGEVRSLKALVIRLAERRN